MKVTVLAGGSSSEREVSLRSGGAVASALQHNNHEVEVLDPAIGLDKILPHLSETDVVFPALHGKGGEDGEIQKFLEDNGIQFVGSDSKASELCFDKHRYGQLLTEHGVLVPKSELVDYQQFISSELIKNPFVLKPNDGGSSIDTFIIRHPDEAPNDDIESTFERHEKLLLQELVDGNEITVAVLHTKALPVVEIITPEGKEFDYENKYNGVTQELCPPINISKELQIEAQSLARQIHKLTDCRDLSRTDMIATKDGKLCVLETNTIPGMTAQSLLPKAAQTAGVSMIALCSLLVDMASKRR